MFVYTNYYYFVYTQVKTALRAAASRGCGAAAPPRACSPPASVQRPASRERPERPLLNNNSSFFPRERGTTGDRGAYAPPHLPTSHHRQHTQANNTHHANQTHAAATCAAPSLQPPRCVKNDEPQAPLTHNPYRKAKEPPSRATEADRRERNADNPNLPGGTREPDTAGENPPPHRTRTAQGQPKEARNTA